MSSLNSLLDALDELTIARKIQAPHDDARNNYHLKSNRVQDFDEFTHIIGDYYNHHFSACMSSGGRLSAAEAAARAKEVLEREYRRRNGDIVTAFRDAEQGLDGGLRGILDHIAEALKAEAVAYYTREMFDRHVAPHEWEDKVAIVRQFLTRFAPLLGSTVRTDQPERYAHDYRELIEAYLVAMKQTSSVFRRL